MMIEIDRVLERPTTLGGVALAAISVHVAVGKLLFLAKNHRRGQGKGSDHEDREQQKPLKRIHEWPFMHWINSMAMKWSTHMANGFIRQIGPFSPYEDVWFKPGAF